MLEKQPENPRQKCENCGAVYRYDSDFQEHLSVGCKVKSGKKKQSSLKDEPAE